MAVLLAVSPISSEEFWRSTRVTITFLATCLVSSSRKSTSCSKLPQIILNHSELHFTGCDISPFFFLSSQNILES